MCIQQDHYLDAISSSVFLQKCPTSPGLMLIWGMQLSHPELIQILYVYYVRQRRSWLKWPRVGATRLDQYTYPVRNWLTSDWTIARRVVDVRGYGQRFSDTGSSTRGFLTPSCERHQRLWDVARSIVHTHLRRTVSPTTFCSPAGHQTWSGFPVKAMLPPRS